ncbi:MAG: hypothetical protein K6L76_01255 [Agarilytica sp.]
MSNFYKLVFSTILFLSFSSSVNAAVCSVNGWYGEDIEGGYKITTWGWHNAAVNGQLPNQFEIQFQLDGTGEWLGTYAGDLQFDVYDDLWVMTKWFFTHPGSHYTGVRFYDYAKETSSTCGAIPFIKPFFHIETPECIPGTPSLLVERGFADERYGSAWTTDSNDFLGVMNTATVKGIRNTGTNEEPYWEAIQGNCQY